MGSDTAARLVLARLVAFSAAASLAGCGGATGGRGGGGNGGPVAACSRFSAAGAEWTLPDIAYYTLALESGRDHWTTLDLDGDGRPDLIRTAGPSGTSAFGTAAAATWQLYRNTGAGFATTAASWPVPGLEYFTVARAVRAERWAVVDLDGDGRPDLVRTMDPASDSVPGISDSTGACRPTCAQGSATDPDGDGWGFEEVLGAMVSCIVSGSAADTGYTCTYQLSAGPASFGAAGAAYWQRFANTGAGFAATPSRWTVPATAYFVLAQATGADYWTTFDIDGDGLPDLVRSNGPTAGAAFGAAPNAYWQVYRNTGAGFATTAASWAVPDASYNRLAGGTERGVWVTIDLDGDRRPDLVRTRGTVAQGTPGISDSTGLCRPACASAASDPDGDGWGWESVLGTMMSCIVSGSAADTGSRCDFAPAAGPRSFGTAADAYWEVFLNTGTGFTAAASRWRLPGDAYHALAGSSDREQWTTFDLDGDRRPELVRSRGAAGGGAIPGIADGTGACRPECRDGAATDPDGDGWGYELVQGSMMSCIVAGSLADTGSPCDFAPAAGPASLGTPADPYWEVFDNTGAGFAAPASRWPLPGNTYFAPAGAGWTTVDIDGDGCPDLVRTAGTTPTTSFGAPASAYWQVHRGQ